MEYKIRKIDFDKDELSLKEFVDNLGEANMSFRYFSSRELSIVKNHLLTILVFNEEDNPIGYGHLEKEDKIWLGIAIIPSYQGKGISKKIMEYLINSAKTHSEIDKISLTVDKDNKKAQQLYEKYSFEKSKSNNDKFFLYELIL